MVTAISCFSLLLKYKIYNSSKDFYIKYANNRIQLIFGRQVVNLKWNEIYCIYTSAEDNKGKKTYSIEMKNGKVARFYAESNLESEIYNHYLEFLESNREKVEHRFSEQFLNRIWRPFKIQCYLLGVVGLVILLCYLKRPDGLPSLINSLILFFVFCIIIIINLFGTKRKQSIVDEINRLVINIKNECLVQLTGNMGFFQTNLKINNGKQLKYIERLSYWPIIREKILKQQNKISYCSLKT